MWHVHRDSAYYNESGGGITASGGEPMLQHTFLQALFKEAKEQRIHTALDTSGYCSGKAFAAILPLTDYLLLDLKIMDPALHKRYTGVSNEVIHDNFRYAVAHGAKVIVRHIVVPGVNDSKKEHEVLAALLLSAGFTGTLELLPYHALARNKYKDLGVCYRMGNTLVPDKERMNNILEYFTSIGIECRIN